MHWLAIIVAAVWFMAGHQVPVRCAPLPSTEGGIYLDGYSTWPRQKPKIVLRPSVCSGLTRFMAGSDDPGADAAVLVLTHEAWHASGLPRSASETTTECRAFDTVALMGWLLGASDERAAGLPGRVLWAHDQIRQHLGYGRFSCT